LPADALSEDALDGLHAITGHRFAAPELLAEALTHPSVTNRERSGDYQRLEFVGDRVLGLVIAARVFREDPAAREGELAVRYNALVRRETLARAAARLDLGRFLQLSRSEEEQGGRDKPTILADALEAVIGALYFDAGLEVAKRFIEQALGPYLEDGEAVKDAKTRLQELLQTGGGRPPDYRVVERSGPDHAPFFVVEVRAEDGRTCVGEGGSRRAAEQAAAAAMLDELHGGG